MKLGIVGAENSHTVAIARILNVQKLFRGFEVSHVWGETRAFAQKAAEAGQISNIVRKPIDMLGKVDCVMVDHRNGKYHLAASIPFVKAGLPVFVDKPMSTSLAEAKRFLKLRHEKGTPVTTLSSIPHQPIVKAIQKELKKIGHLKTVHLQGPGEYKSKYGGIWFYGIHQVDLMVELFGVEVKSVQATVNGESCIAVCNYPNDLIVSITFVPKLRPFSLTAIGDKGAFHQPVKSDGNPYAVTTRLFTRMFKTGREPFSDERMLAPIAVLEAMQKSLTSKRVVKVSSL